MTVGFAEHVFGSPLPDHPGRTLRRRGLQPDDKVTKDGEVIRRQVRSDPSGGSAFEDAM